MECQGDSRGPQGHFRENFKGVPRVFRVVPGGLRGYQEVSRGSQGIPRNIWSTSGDIRGFRRDSRRRYGCLMKSQGVSETVQEASEVS